MADKKSSKDVAKEAKKATKKATKPTPEAKEDGTVTLSESQFKEMMSRIANVERHTGQAKPMSLYTNDQSKVIRVRKWDGEYVIGFGDRRVYSEYDEKRRKENLFIELKLNNGKEVVVPYLDYLNNSATEMAKVINTVTKPHVESVGDTFKKDEVDGRMVSLDQQIPMEVKYEFRTYEVETKDGTELTLPESVIH